MKPKELTMLLARAIGAIENPKDLTSLEIEEVVADLQAAIIEANESDTALIASTMAHFDLSDEEWDATPVTVRRALIDAYKETY